ncbi:hypothetical protein Acr_02g0011230 [Actinidia rufa]|uniref:Uncharacterized protein n=1 Tax=Actinidia rufa TaxID=165716 RepID=A0A7J0E8S7_9ERIC|nr:hypothetical protein Acr_02g0011230 [Actinidia rufa]
MPLKASNRILQFHSKQFLPFEVPAFMRRRTMVKEGLVLDKVRGGLVRKGLGGDRREALFWAEAVAGGGGVHIPFWFAGRS